MVTFSGFNTIANNHIGGRRIRAGGVAVLACKDITIHKLEVPKAYVKNLDCVTVVIQRNNEKFVLMGIYRRPGNRLQRGVMKKLINKVKEICKQKYGKELSVVLAGDFNAHNRSWNCQDTDFSGESLLEDTEEEELFVVNTDTMSHGKLWTTRL